MPRYIKITVLQSLLALTLAAFSPVFALPLVSIQPSSQMINSGQAFILDVTVSDVVDLYGFQFDLGFSPGLLAATGMTEGAFLPSGGASFFIPGMIDNTAGAISFTADTLLGPGPGVTGTGILASIDFIVSGSGISSVFLSNVLLLDSTLTDIPSTTGDAAVEVLQSAAVPEPTTILLLGFGVFGVVAVRRWV